ncbi:hypothetical protein HMPREF1320_1728 [Capnocytophaga sp. oral taxon 335 str. F0486]|nr:hypothetical protein HMPREF1320_1728 [Capnocytophaga sp. oral taxon 335 str. F0486]
MARTACRATIYNLNKKKAPLIGAFSERNFKHKYNVKVSN